MLRGLFDVLFMFFVLRKGKEKNSLLLFPFHCNKNYSHYAVLEIPRTHLFYS